MLYNSLPWRSTVNDVSQDFTTFMPLTNYSRPTTTLLDVLARALFLPADINAAAVMAAMDSGSETGSGSVFSQGSREDSEVEDDSTAEIEMSAAPALLGSSSSNSTVNRRNYGAMEYSAVQTVDEFGVPFLGLENVAIQESQNNV